MSNIRPLIGDDAKKKVFFFYSRLEFKCLKGTDCYNRRQKVFVGKRGKKEKEIRKERKEKHAKRVLWFTLMGYMCLYVYSLQPAFRFNGGRCIFIDTPSTAELTLVTSHAGHKKKTENDHNGCAEDYCHHRPGRRKKLLSFFVMCVCSPSS